MLLERAAPTMTDDQGMCRRVRFTEWCQATYNGSRRRGSGTREAADRGAKEDS